MKIVDVLEAVGRDGGMKLKTAREGDYRYARLVKTKPVTRAVLTYRSLEEDVPLAFVKYLELRFGVRFGGGDGGSVHE